MKALNIKQPWAWLIANGNKGIETRTWLTKYRGPLLIVASKAPMTKIEKRLFFRSFPQAELDIEYGKAVCVANLTACRLMKKADENAACCDIYDRACSWVLMNTKKIKPFPVEGQLGLYDVPIPIETIDRYNLNL